MADQSPLAAPVPIAPTEHLTVPVKTLLTHPALLIGGAVVALCLIGITFSMAYAAYRHRAPMVATVDLQKLVEEDQQRTIAALGKTPNGVASDEQRSTYLKNTTDFAQKLEASIERVAQQCRCVLVNKAAVLGGETPDYTDGVRMQLGKP